MYCVASVVTCTVRLYIRQGSSIVFACADHLCAAWSGLCLPVPHMLADSMRVAVTAMERAGKRSHCLWVRVYYNACPTVLQINSVSSNVLFEHGVQYQVDSETIMYKGATIHEHKCASAGPNRTNQPI